MSDTDFEGDLPAEVEAGLLAARAACLRSLQPALDEILRGGYGLHPQDAKSSLFADWFAGAGTAVETQGDPLAEDASTDGIVTAIQEQIERQRQGDGR